MVKSNISGVYSHKYAKIQISLDDYLHLEKIRKIKIVIYNNYALCSYLY